MIDEIMLIDKPSGMTSFGVVARIRRVLSAQAGKRTKVGHTGTLDPFATGLMVVLTGKQTKNASQYSKLDKVYEAEVVLGKISTTGDPEGEVTAVSNTVPTRQDVQQALDSFTGQVVQKPPAFSAIKIGGQRAYKLARAGQVVDVPERTVTIYNIELIDYSYPLLKFTAHVSSGTYIRTLAEDIGNKLGTGAYTAALRRIRVGNFDIKNAQALTDLGITN
ncbi:MAG: tRNA pseudouridine(55) synthase TruB [Candidatus Nomurabacteria bacterium]|jgi:tRNA pseudouridine55 synthase|nr:tRNA pseudouridine(55) synthase TruB [Candidatus Nomurabacteria bacterium]